jgi:hypothetical protein
MMAVPESSSVVVRHEEPQAIVINVRCSKRAVYALSCEHEVHIKLRVAYMFLTLLKA